MTNPTPLSYVAAREHVDDLTRAAEQSRLAATAREREVDSERGGLVAWLAGGLSRRVARRSSGATAVAPPSGIEP